MICASYCLEKGTQKTDAQTDRQVLDPIEPRLHGVLVSLLGLVKIIYPVETAPLSPLSPSPPRTPAALHRPASSATRS